jgi:DME family drug/metabolite transporter
MGSATASRLRLLAAALLFSTGGAAIKACTLTGWQVASFRSAIAALALLVLLPDARRRWTWGAVAVGSAYASTMILFVLGNKLTTAANTIFLQSTAPLYLLLLGPWLLREPIRRRDVVFMAVLAIGMSMFFVGTDVTYASAPHPARGNVVAALSGVSWALTITGLRWMSRATQRRDGSVGVALVAGNLLAGAACLPLALPVRGGGVVDWLLLGYLGVFQIGFAYIFVSTAVRHVPALEASLLLLLEPVLNPVWAWMIHGEQPGAWSLGGGALILLATAIRSWWEVRASPQRGVR